MDESYVWYKRKIVWGFVLILILIPVGAYIYKYSFMAREPQPTPYLTNNTLTDKAVSIGYDIIWVSPKDSTGRTVFYKERAKAETDFRGTGLVYTQATASATQKSISYIAGGFFNFQEIKDSPDLYINFINPQTGISLPTVRIILSKNSSFKTFFRVENLSYGPNNPYDEVKNKNEGDLGVLSDWTVDKLKKIITTGDAVVVSGLNKTDNSKALIGTMLVIRRFDGQKQIEKELQP